MSGTNSSSSDIEQLKQDLTALKADVASLVGHLKAGASNGVESAVNQIDEGAQTLYRNVGAEGGRAMKAISDQVEQQPLVALLLALGGGYVGGRCLSR